MQESSHSEDGQDDAAQDVSDALVEQARAGDQDALTELFERHRERLTRMVQLRMDRRVKARVDVSDVIQEAYVDLADQLANYAKDPKLPFFLWLRRITGQRLAKVHRFHLGQEKRNIARDRPMYNQAMPDATSICMANELVGTFSTASRKLQRRELQASLQEIIETMPENDREIIALRHIEQLTNAEAAAVLEIDPKAASKRHVRALRHLRTKLSKVPGMLD